MFSDGQVPDRADGVFLGFRGRWVAHHLQNVAQKVSRQQLYLGEGGDWDFLKVQLTENNIKYIAIQ